MAKTTELIAALRCSSSVPSAQLDCRTCAFHMEETVDDKDYAGCECDRILVDAADKIEELVDRCARYAEEIAVLQEKQKWVDAGGVTPQGCPRCGGVGLVVVPATRGDVLRRMSDRELAVQLFDFRFDGYAKAQGAETVLPDTIQSIESWLKEEMGK